MVLSTSDFHTFSQSWMLIGAFQMFLQILPKHVWRGGGNSNIFGIFNPKIGERFPFWLYNIFQLGWFNQLDDQISSWKTTERLNLCLVFLCCNLLHPLKASHKKRLSLCEAGGEKYAPSQIGAFVLGKMKEQLSRQGNNQKGSRVDRCDPYSHTECVEKGLKIHQRLKGTESQRTPFSKLRSSY